MRIIILLGTIFTMVWPSPGVQIQDHRSRLGEKDKALIGLCLFLRYYERGEDDLALSYLSRDYEDDEGLRYEEAKELLKRGGVKVRLDLSKVGVVKKSKGLYEVWIGSSDDRIKVLVRKEYRSYRVLSFPYFFNLISEGE